MTRTYLQTGYHHQGKFDVTDWLPTIVSAALGPDSASTWKDFIPKYWNYDSKECTVLVLLME